MTDEIVIPWWFSGKILNTDIHPINVRRLGETIATIQPGITWETRGTVAPETSPEEAD